MKESIQQAESNVEELLKAVEGLKSTVDKTLMSPHHSASVTHTDDVERYSRRVVTLEQKIIDHDKLLQISHGEATVH